MSPNTNEVIYKGKPLKGMSNPSPLAFLDLPLTGEQSVSPIVTKEQLSGKKGHWPTVSAKVKGTLEISDRAAKKITVRVDKAQVGNDACIDDAPKICHTEVESTLSRVGRQSHGGHGSQHFRDAHHLKTRPTCQSVHSL